MERLKELFSEFKSLPVLFVGAGISRRYLQTENWESLLRKYANIVHPQNPYSFEQYRSTVPEQYKNTSLEFPCIATAIEHDYNRLWFDNQIEDWKNCRETEDVSAEIRSGTSPFKVELARHFSNVKINTSANPLLEKELSQIKKIATNNIAAIITTNYDQFLETMFPAFITYIGQNDLLFTQYAEVGEIYKIHGCCTKPSTIVIDLDDYEAYEKQQAFLTAKMATLFIDHPVIFLGYRIGDPNIQSILNTLARCMNEQQRNEFSQRLFFVSFTPDKDVFEMQKTSMQLPDSDSSINLTEIRTHVFCPIYEDIASTKAQFSVKVLRQLKESVYYVATNATDKSKHVRLMGIDENTSLEDIDYVIGVGVLQDVGYSLISYEDILYDILFDSAHYDPVRIISSTLPILSRRMGGGKVAGYKYAIQASANLTEELRGRMNSSFDSFLTESIKQEISRKGKKYKKYHAKTIEQIISESPSKEEIVFHQCFLFLNQDNIDPEILRGFLKSILLDNPDILTTPQIAGTFKTEFKRLVRLFDWLKYAQKKTECTTFSSANMRINTVQCVHPYVATIIAYPNEKDNMLYEKTTSCCCVKKSEGSK